MYDPLNWYWKMDNTDPNMVWSSASMGFVSVTDPVYVSWSQQNIAPRMSFPSLYQIMLTYKPAAAAALAANNQSDLLPSQVVDAMLAAGLEITSASNTSLNGTYAIDMNAQIKITAIFAGISDGKGFPNDVSVIGWPNFDGNPHQFTSDEFSNLAIAVRDFVYELYATEVSILAGNNVRWPTPSKTIA